MEQNRNLLFVDDSPSYRLIFRTVFAKTNPSVSLLCVASSTAALEQLKRTDVKWTGLVTDHLLDAAEGKGDVTCVDGHVQGGERAQDDEDDADDGLEVGDGVAR